MFYILFKSIQVNLYSKPLGIRLTTNRKTNRINTSSLPRLYAQKQRGSRRTDIEVGDERMHRDRPINVFRQRQTDRQADKQADRQTDRQIDGKKS
jgi:hypothetical protein